MKTYEIHIKSICAMLHHGSQAVGMDKPQTKKKGGQALMGDAEEWKKTIYYNPEVGVYLPAMVFEGCLKNAAKQFKITGRATATKYVESGFFCIDEYLSFLVDGKPIKTLDDERIHIDKRSVKNPSTRGRNMRYRAKFDNWESKFKAIVTADDYIKHDLLEGIIEYAGNYIGVGDYRPRFGRFKLVSLEEIQDDV